MPELTLSHIDQISRDIRQQEISFSHLMDELIDHVCCDVEYEMEKGLSFAEAYQKVKSNIGPRGLKEIQEETLYAVDTKYRKMKNTMKITGITGTIMLGIASVLKILHFPGGSILMTIGAVLLALCFLPASLVVLWKETHNSKRLILFVAAFLTGVTFIMGVLFKTQHWPAAELLLSISVMSAIFLFLPFLLHSKLTNTENIRKRPVYILGFIGMVFYLAGFWSKLQHWPFSTLLMSLGSVILMVIVLPWHTFISWKEDEHISSKFIFIISTIALFVMPAALINLSFAKSYDDEFFVHLDQQHSIIVYRQKSNEKLLAAYKDSVQYERLEQIHLKTSDLIGKIDQIEQKMINLSEKTNSEGNPSVLAEPLKENEIRYRNLKNPFNRFIVKFVLYPEAATRVEFDKTVQSYISFITENMGKEFISRYEPLLNPSMFLPDENSYIGENALISGIHSLALYRNSILQSENAALNRIITH